MSCSFIHKGKSNLVIPKNERQTLAKIRKVQTPQKKKTVKDISKTKKQSRLQFSVQNPVYKLQTY